MNYIDRIAAVFTRRNTVAGIMAGFAKQVQQLEQVQEEQDGVCKSCADQMIVLGDKSRAAREERDAAKKMANKLREFVS